MKYLLYTQTFALCIQSGEAYCLSRSIPERSPQPALSVHQSRLAEQTESNPKVGAHNSPSHMYKVGKGPYLHSL